MKEMFILRILDFIIDLNFWWDECEEPKRTILFFLFAFCSWTTIILNSLTGIAFIFGCLFYRVIYVNEYKKIIKI